MIIDSSVIVKLVLREPGSDYAYEVLREAGIHGEELSTPDIALPETLNAIWRHHKLLKDIDEPAYREATKDALKLWNTLRTYETREIAIDACEIAIKTQTTIYDALYLALTRKLNSKLFTFDRKMIEIAKNLKIETLPIK